MFDPAIRQKAVSESYFRLIWTLESDNILVEDGEREWIHRTQNNAQYQCESLQQFSAAIGFFSVNLLTKLRMATHIFCLSMYNTPIVRVMNVAGTAEAT